MTNGHETKPQWNVALWIANDEGLYRLALDCIKQASTKRQAAMYMLDDLTEFGLTHTPDGYPYTFTSIRKALIGLT